MISLCSPALFSYAHPYWEMPETCHGPCSVSTAERFAILLSKIHRLEFPSLPLWIPGTKWSKGATLKPGKDSCIPQHPLCWTSQDYFYTLLQGEVVEQDREDCITHRCRRAMGGWKKWVSPQSHATLLFRDKRSLAVSVGIQMLPMDVAAYLEDCL